MSVELVMENGRLVVRDPVRKERRELLQTIPANKRGAAQRLMELAAKTKPKKQD
ncbi:MAG TPA: hypothetical protein VD902_09565 [Symbiobacteriaceae bacterium]|nr:hypothetical protein [Symbiobacteriaceae bacterium]